MEQLSFDFYKSHVETTESKYERMLIDKIRERKHVTPCELNGVYYWYYLETPYIETTVTQMNSAEAEVVDSLVKSGKLIPSGILNTKHVLYFYQH